MYPRWPLRAADPAEALTPVQAETLVEGADNWDVLRLLHRGESVSTLTATPSTIVAASLVRPGLTAVILDADPVPDDEEPTPAAIQEVAKAPTPSIARQPTPKTGRRWKPRQPTRTDYGSSAGVSRFPSPMGTDW